MLRDPSLIPLSHQHHNGLALCVMTRRSLAADASRGKHREAGEARHRSLRDSNSSTTSRSKSRCSFRPAEPLPLIDELLADHRAIEALRRPVARGSLRGAAGGVLRAAHRAHPARGERALRAGAARTAARGARPGGRRNRSPRGAHLPLTLTRSTGWRPCARDRAVRRYSPR